MYDDNDLYGQTVEPARRTMTLFFVVDVSGSMSGSKIGAVNTAIEEVIPTIRDISAENADAQIKVAALKFSTGTEWVDPAPVAAENFRWNYLNAGGLTDLGAACTELNAKLSTSGFMQSASGSYAPVLFLMSDGEPTDDWEHGLEKLKQNNWYKAALKIAIAIGDDANTNVLAKFTGNVESVITVHTPEELKKWIRFVSVTSSQIGSKGRSIGNKNLESDPTGEPETKTKQMITAIENEKKNDQESQTTASDAPVQPSNTGNEEDVW